MALEAERKKGSFDREELTNLIDTGADATERRRLLQSKGLEALGIKGNNAPLPSWSFLSKEEKYNDAIRKAIIFRNAEDELGSLDFQETHILSESISPNEPGPLLLHQAMFEPTIMSQASEKQREYLMEKIKSFEIIGTYAQTEMGHGTHLRGLETVATYDPTTEEFIVNSPTLTSTKWWPGGLGKTVNHVVLMANLIIKGRNYGMQPFILQTRDIDTHRSMPGIEVGDIGPKLGFNSNDNGYLRCNNVRIPRDNMLTKNAEVLPDGTYVNRAKTGKAVYGTMVLTRIGIIVASAFPSISKAATIAIRYSCVRRQSEIKPGEPEPQILDFITQQHKLFPVLAEAYAINSSAESMKLLYMESMMQMMLDDGSGAGFDISELHALSSGLKAYSTDRAAQGVEICRKACGGHGYSQASGFPKLYVGCTAACTYEGENTVLYLQTARYLMKVVDALAKKDSISGGLANDYLSKQSVLSSQTRGIITLENIREELGHAARRKIYSAKRSLHGYVSGGTDYHDAWNLSGVELVIAAKAHIQVYVIESFIETVKNIDSPALKKVMTNLCLLHGCCALVENADALLEDGYMAGQQMSEIRKTLAGLLSDIRPEAVSLVDAFDYSDYSLGSVLGRHDGCVYENLFKWAQDSPLNKTDVHPSFEKYIVPYRMKLRKAKL